MTLTKVLTAMEELDKWEEKARDIEKIIRAIKRKKRMIRKQIEKIESDISRYDELLEDKRKEMSEMSAGFPLRGQ